MFLFFFSFLSRCRSGDGTEKQMKGDLTSGRDSKMLHCVIIITIIFRRPANEFRCVRIVIVRDLSASLINVHMPLIFMHAEPLWALAGAKREFVHCFAGFRLNRRNTV